MSEVRAIFLFAVGCGHCQQLKNGLLKDIISAFGARGVKTSQYTAPSLAGFDNANDVPGFVAKIRPRWFPCMVLMPEKIHKLALANQISPVSMLESMAVFNGAISANNLTSPMSRPEGSAKYPSTTDGYLKFLSDYIQSGILSRYANEAEPSERLSQPGIVYQTGMGSSDQPGKIVEEVCGRFIPHPCYRRK